jgi:hypothetical protein
MQKNKTDTIELGTFTVKSGRFIISDPCYNRGTWCSGMLENVMRGEWKAYVLRRDTGSWGVRCAELIVCHNEFPFEKLSFAEKTEFDIGVDSGQAGIYCDSEFHGGEDEYGEDGWYDACCQATLNNQRGAGVLPGGVVSASGFGDGSFDAFVERNPDGQVIGAKVVFVTEDDLKDE